MKYASVLVLGLVMACGPSGAEMRTAKTSEYTLQPKQMFEAAAKVTMEDYKILEQSIDFQNNSFATVPQWYTPEGGRISAYSEGNGDYVNAGGGDVQVWFVVSVLQMSDNNTFVDIHPRTLQLVSGSPQPRELKEDDPNLPPWIHGRVDSLSYKIYEAAKQYAIAPSAGSMPRPRATVDESSAAPAPTSDNDDAPAP